MRNPFRRKSDGALLDEIIWRQSGGHASIYRLRFWRPLIFAISAIIVALGSYVAIETPLHRVDTWARTQLGDKPKVSDHLTGRASIIDDDTLDICGTRIRLWVSTLPKRHNSASATTKRGSTGTLQRTRLRSGSVSEQQSVSKRTSISMAASSAAASSVAPTYPRGLSRAVGRWRFGATLSTTWHMRIEREVCAPASGQPSSCHRGNGVGQGHH